MGEEFDIQIRFPIDDAVVSRLHDRAFGNTADGRVHGWAAQLERHALTWVGAFERERLIGFVQVCWDGGVHAFVLDTAVDPAYQRRGIGQALVRAAADEAAAAGCEWLHVDFEPHLRTFYLESCGFRSTDAGLLRLRPGAL